jgi:hypothetical protein
MMPPRCELMVKNQSKQSQKTKSHVATSPRVKPKVTRAELGISYRSTSH